MPKHPRSTGQNVKNTAPNRRAETRRARTESGEGKQADILTPVKILYNIYFRPNGLKAENYDV